MTRSTRDDGVNGQTTRRITRGNTKDRQHSALEIDTLRTKHPILSSTANRRQSLASFDDPKRGISSSRKRKRPAGIPENAGSEEVVSPTSVHQTHSFTAHSEPLADLSSSAHSLGNINGRKRQDGCPKGQDFPPPYNCGPSGTHHAPAFWDSLSEIYLNKRALQEFDRRTLQNHRVSRDITPSTHIAIDHSLVEHRFITNSKASPNLKRFARAGGPDLSDLKGYPPPPSVTMGSQNSTLRRNANVSDMGPPTQPASRRDASVVNAIGSTPISSITKSTKTRSTRASAYDPNFMRILVNNGVKPIDPDDIPGNLDQWKKRLAQPHASLSPTTFTNAQFKEFCRAMRLASSEPNVMIGIFPTIKGADTYRWEADRLCTGWEPLAKNVVIAKPDYFEGALPIPENDHLRQLMASMIVPYDHYQAPLLPNFFLEAKSSKGVDEVARNQACHDGAMGARGMHHVQNYRRAEIFDGNAYTFTSTLVSGTLQTYLHFITQPNGLGKGVEYHMTPAGGWLLMDSMDSFLAGVTAFRNARDIAHEFREQFIREANERIEALPSLSIPSSPTRNLATESDNQIQSDRAELVTLPDPANSADLDPNEPSSKRRKTSVTPELTVTPKLKAAPKFKAAAGKAKAKTAKLRRGLRARR